ncbi:alpha-N-arabinofuranosidase [Candidatus Latescibacterota bacterium]
MNRLSICADQETGRVSRHIYGHFAEHLGHCIYEGLWVGEDSPIPNVRGIRTDLVEALRRIGIPNLRWPGGCFADEYHWMDGIGPRQQRLEMINTHWGGLTENNHFGTHEFMDLCEQLECEPYICGNLGSGTVREMQQWVEYLTVPAGGPMANLRRDNGHPEPWKVRMWGVGNENWGCGGQMRPEYYADEYRRFATYLRNFGGNELYKVACGPSGGDYHWTEVLMREAARYMHGLALHFYCGSGRESRSATQFDEGDWFFQLHSALKMDELITRHTAIMDQYDPEGRVELLVDEWGAWHAVEPDTNPRFLYQQNSLRDALVASVTLDIFNRHCRRVTGGNIAQTINVLQAMALTDGPKMTLTPTYHVFDMYTPHHDAVGLPVHVACDAYQDNDDSIPQLSASATRAAQGTVTLTITNLHPNNTAEVPCAIHGLDVKSATARVLTADTITAHNTFDSPDTVAPVQYDGAIVKGGDLLLKLPPRSVTAVSVE